MATVSRGTESFILRFAVDTGNLEKGLSRAWTIAQKEVTQMNRLFDQIQTRALKRHPTLAQDPEKLAEKVKSIMAAMDRLERQRIASERQRAAEEKRFTAESIANKKSKLKFLWEEYKTEQWVAKAKRDKVAADIANEKRAIQSYAAQQKAGQEYANKMSTFVSNYAKEWYKLLSPAEKHQLQLNQHISAARDLLSLFQQINTAQRGAVGGAFKGQASALGMADVDFYGGVGKSLGTRYGSQVTQVASGIEGVKKFKAEVNQLGKAVDKVVIPTGRVEQNVTKIGRAADISGRKIQKHGAVLDRWGHRIHRAGEHLEVMGVHMWRLDRLIVFYGALEGMKNIKRLGDAAVKTGIEFNSMREQVQLGLSGIISSYYTLTDAQGKTLSGADAFNASMDLSANIFNRLMTASLQTTATVEDLARGFQEGAAVGAAYGLTLDQLLDLTTRFQLMSQALRVKPQELGQEIREIFTGGTDPRKARLGFQIWAPERLAGKDVKKTIRDLSQDSEKLYQLLMERTAQFGKIGEKTAYTWEGVLSNLKEAWQRAMGGATLGGFESIKARLIEVYEYIVKINDGQAEIVNVPFLSSLNQYAQGWAEVLDKIKQAYFYLKNFNVQQAIREGVSAEDAVSRVDTALEVAAEHSAAQWSFYGLDQDEMQIAGPLKTEMGPYNPARLVAAAMWSVESALAGLILGATELVTGNEASRQMAEKKQGRGQDILNRERALDRVYRNKNLFSPINLDEQFTAAIVRQQQMQGPTPEGPTVDTLAKNIEEFRLKALEEYKIFTTTTKAITADAGIAFKELIYNASKGGYETLGKAYELLNKYGGDLEISLEDVKKISEELFKTPLATADPNKPGPQIDPEELERLRKAKEKLLNQADEELAKTKVAIENSKELRDLQNSVPEDPFGYLKTAQNAEDYLSKVQELRDYNKKLLGAEKNYKEDLLQADKWLNDAQEKKLGTDNEIIAKWDEMRQAAKAYYDEVVAGIKETEPGRTKLGGLGDMVAAEKGAMEARNSEYDQWNRNAQAIFAEIARDRTIRQQEIAIAKFEESIDYFADAVGSFGQALASGILSGDFGSAFTGYLQQSVGTGIDSLIGKFLDHFAPSFEQFTEELGLTFRQELGGWIGSDGNLFGDTAKVMEQYQAVVKQRQLAQAGIQGVGIGVGAYFQAQQGEEPTDVWKGALTGAAAGAAGGWIGAIVGAIAGAFGTWLGNQNIKDTRQWGVPVISDRRGRTPYDPYIGVSGPRNIDEAEVIEMIEAIRDKFFKTWNAYVRMLHEIGQLDMPNIGMIGGHSAVDDLGGKANKQFMDLFQSWLDNTLPEEIRMKFMDQLKTGFVNLGMTADAFDEFADALGNMSAEDKIKVLNDYIYALKGMNEVLDYMGIIRPDKRSARGPHPIRQGDNQFPWLRDDAARFNIERLRYEGMRTFADQLKDTDAEILEFGATMQDLIGPERIQAAKEFTDLMAKRMEKEKGYLQSVLDITERIGESIGAQKRQYTLELMKTEDGTQDYQRQVDFLKARAEFLLGQVQGASSPEEVARWMQEYQSVISQIVGISDQMSPEAGDTAREWALQVLEISEQIYAERMDELVQELQDRNEEFAEAVDVFVQSIYELFGEGAPDTTGNTPGGGPRENPWTPRVRDMDLLTATFVSAGEALTVSLETYSDSTLLLNDRVTLTADRFDQLNNSLQAFSEGINISLNYLGDGVQSFGGALHAFSQTWNELSFSGGTTSTFVPDTGGSSPPAESSTYYASASIRRQALSKK